MDSMEAVIVKFVDVVDVAVEVVARVVLVITSKRRGSEQILLVSIQVRMSPMIQFGWWSL